MLISRHWLGRLLDGPALPDADGIGALLTSLGLEYDGVTHHGGGCTGVIVGEVRAKAPHPQADRLTLVTIFDGSRELPVVCGAPNVPAPGGFVAFAPPGITLPGGLTIATREIRGVVSSGMICSERELEIGDDHEGILVLTPADVEPEVGLSLAPGVPLTAIVPGIVDAVLELSITPNRPDALGHVGVARDLAVKLDCGLRLPGLAGAPDPEQRARNTWPAGIAERDHTLVEIPAGDRCGRYIGRALTGATIRRSPLWMRVRLHNVGLRPINNCVDITNFVLMEWGQPLHVFDRDKLAEGRVVVRMAGEGEAFAALDGREVTLSADDLVIADARAPQALAGVMGGAPSMVTDATRNLLLEAAHFTPRFIRRTARRHGFATDSSYRFERGVDHGFGLEHASQRAAQLLADLSGATAVSWDDVDGQRPAAPAIRLRLARVALVLGYAIPEDRARAILSGLGVSIVDEAPGVFRCTPPGHRPDLAIEEDLIEELMRVYGLEAMPAQATVPSAPIDERRDARFELRDRVIDGLRAGGLRELVSYAFTSAEKLDPVADGIPAERRVIVQNPLRSQHGIMRTNLLAGLLDCLEANASRHPRPIKVFEVGRIYAWPAGAREHAGPTAAVDRLLPDERLQAALLLYGGATGRGELDGAPIDAHLAGGLLLHALAQLGFTAQLAPMTSLIPYLHPGVQAAVVIAGVGEVGHFGEVHPDLLATRELPAGCRAYHGWLDLEALPDLPIRRHGSIPRFPETSRDLSLELPITVPAADVVEALEVGATAILEALEGDDPIRLVGAGAAAQAIEVLEDYRGKGIPDGRRALLLRLHYGAAGRSVTDAEAQVVHQQIVERAQRSLAEGHRAEVRVR